MEDHICAQTIHVQKRLLLERQISSQELVGSYIDRIKKIDPKINGYVILNAEAALAKAKDVNKMLSRIARNTFLVLNI